MSKKSWFCVILLIFVFTGVIFYWRNQRRAISTFSEQNNSNIEQKSEAVTLVKPELDKASYDAKLLFIANNIKTASSSEINAWPPNTPYPLAGAILPFNRIVAYYGNLYSKNMGVLGEYSEDEMLYKLQTEVKKWEKADPATPVIPALHYIAVVAQHGPSKDGKYRLRMPDKEIDKVIAMSEKIHGIVFLDIQIGQSNVETEVPLLEKYLKLPNVNLGIDPEFAMHNGDKPGTVIGNLDAKDFNFALEYLSKIVKENQLPPKILVIHRFTKAMVTNYKNITPLPEVQVVINMDGFGSRAVKLNTYKQYIFKEPVQFTGFKMFYKNDTVAGPMFEPEDLLKLRPIPIYIQYQ